MKINLENQSRTELAETFNKITIILKSDVSTLLQISYIYILVIFPTKKILKMIEAKGTLYRLS